MPSTNHHDSPEASETHPGVTDQDTTTDDDTPLSDEDRLTGDLEFMDFILDDFPVLADTGLADIRDTLETLTDADGIPVANDLLLECGWRRH